jgi:hypothetical protein
MRSDTQYPPGHAFRQFQYTTVPLDPELQKALSTPLDGMDLGPVPEASGG